MCQLFVEIDYFLKIKVLFKDQSKLFDDQPPLFIKDQGTFLFIKGALFRFLNRFYFFTSADLFLLFSLAIKEQTQEKSRFRLALLSLFRTFLKVRINLNHSQQKSLSRKYTSSIKKNPFKNQNPSLSSKNQPLQKPHNNTPLNLNNSLTNSVT